MTTDASNIYVAGKQGIVCSAIVCQMQSIPCVSVVPTANLLTRTLAELDLKHQAAV